jgi:acyl-CoA dehydrogenase
MNSWRQRWISAPLLRRLKKILPPISDTEREALEAGDVGWDAEILSGKPDWSAFLALDAPVFSAEEQAFLEGPVAELCSMIDDWAITAEQRCIPEPIWQFLKEKRFFGMIIPKQYGGLEFSAYAHSEVVMRISTRSIAVAVTVMVPNSLGPGELLMEFGTQAQKDHYLPRLADGREIPCFGLTSPEAGSDAAAMIDRGDVCYQEHNGERVLGIKLNWHKRYITLGPVATLLGLAFKLYDPDHLISDREEWGITAALVPTDLEGIDIGRRHYPAMQAFQNGPNWGKDVFIPMGQVIGGQDGIGQGWKMLMTALAAGRSISLPSLSVGGAILAARTTGAYARIREQFGIPVGKFEGVQQCLAQIAATAYVLDAARKTSMGVLQTGKVPVVISAILKSQATYRLRNTINDAMDVHGGKTVCDGPANYLANMYRSIPVAITVEGANILTRNLIIFGQGAIRCHPFLLQEMQVAEQTDEAEAVKQFDELLFKHLRFQCATLGRAVLHTWTFGRFASAPPNVGNLACHYRALSRYSAVLTLVTEIALVSLGGALKRKELISARLGDVLGELYLLSCALKRFNDEGCPEESRPLLDWCMHTGINTIRQRLGEVTANFPIRPLGWLMRMLVLPFGAGHTPPSDRLTRQCAELLLSDSLTRRRLTDAVFTGNPGDGIDRIEQAFIAVINTEILRKKLSGKQTIEQALSAQVITPAEAQLLKEAEQAVVLAIAVDDFDADLK